MYTVHCEPPLPILHTKARVVIFNYKLDRLTPHSKCMMVSHCPQNKIIAPWLGLCVLVCAGPCFPPSLDSRTSLPCLSWTTLLFFQSPNPLACFCLRIFALRLLSAWNAPLLSSFLQLKLPKGESPIKEQPPERSSATSPNDKKLISEDV